MKTRNMAKHFFSIFTVLFFIIIAFGSRAKGEKEGKTNADGSLMTERQIEVENQFSSWDGSHPGLTRLIKEHMNDPKSFEHIETRFIDYDDYIDVITTFTGKNVFGGRVKQTVTANVDFEGNVIEILSHE